MRMADIFKQYLEHLFEGKRCEARQMMLAAQDRGVPASKLLKHVVWPAMEQVERLYRENEIARITEHMATRINRLVADQLQALMARKPKSGQRMIVVCGDGEGEELGAQIIADVFESRGWSVWFLGSGVPNDEIMQFLGKTRPDILCVYGAQPSGVPGLRKLIEMIREIGGFEQMQVLAAGGVFNRAHGLGDEIRADLFAANVCDALTVIEDHPVRVPKPDVPQPGRRRKRRQRPERAGSPRRGRVTVGARS